MDAKELIQLNNVKRKQLDKENQKFYEDMLVYIRLSYDKPEQETEEVLSELLDHLVEAQLEGRSASDVFGDDPKHYADQIIGELPKMVTKERLRLFSMAILYFFASVSIFSALFTVINYFIFNLHSLSQEILLGSLLIKTVSSIPIAFLFLYAIIQYFRWTCFREINKAAEFLVYWLFGMMAIGVFVLLIFIIPDIGPVMEVPVYITALLGLILYFAARMTRKSI